MAAAAEMGLIGLGVMGRNLALNLADHGVLLAAYDLDEGAGAELAERAEIRLARSPAALAEALKPPRAVLLMVNAGAATDRAIQALVPALQAGDIVIDGGNAHYRDTIRRAEALRENGLRFIGLGVSGGAEGARHGPALMAGGEESAYRALEPMLGRIAAKAAGRACLGYFGADGAGHFVKMAHNAIEYAVMGAIADAWLLMSRLTGLDHDAIAREIAGWNGGEQQSYLLEITAEVLARLDPETKRPIIEVILDKAEQKGTGAWAVEAGLALGVPIPSLAEAVFQRSLSALKEERVAAERSLGAPARPPASDADALRAALPQALFAATLVCYAQGFQLMRAAAGEHGWAIRLAEVAAVWQGGCILRADLLGPIEQAYRQQPSLASLLLDQRIAAAMAAADRGWRRVVAAAAESGVPAPILGSALAYWDGYRLGRGPAALIQAQRDRFGDHGFQRTDRPGVQHGPWHRGR